MTDTKKKGRLLIVSNRLPVSVEMEGFELNFHASAGGLVTGLSSFYRERQAFWIGWPGIVPPRKEKEVETILTSKYNCHPVFLPDELAERYYEGFTNKTLWPLLHSFPMYTEYCALDWQAYQEANQLFCESIMKIAGPDDVIWIHDYHLMLLPKYLREAIPGISLGFFLHIPFPNYDILRLLPQHKEIVESLLASDLIGFHTYDYAEAFLLGVRRLLGYDNNIGQIIAGRRVVQVDVFPMGVDFFKFSNTSQPDVQNEIAKIRERIGSHKLVFSVSRLDYTKGIPQHLEAIEEFFDRYPEWLGKIVFMLALVPSREKVDRYALLKREIDELVGRINSKYGTLNWMPILYVYGYLNFEELVALYASADIALTIPLRDGMNLIAKEYIATKNGGKGVLVLSETAGASKELLEAIIVNPNSREEVAEALHNGLTMPEDEQISRNQMMSTRLINYDITRWAKTFLQRLTETADLSKNLSVRFLDASSQQRLIKDYMRARRRLLMLDYDGTLSCFVNDPAKAKPTYQVLEILERLSLSPNNEVVLISGRDKQSLEKWFGHLNITLVSEHGGWSRDKNTRQWEATVHADDLWKKQILPILQLFVNRIPGSFIEEKTFSLAWHYRKADIGIASTAAKGLVDSLTNLTANLDIFVLPGNKVVEIKSSAITKGAFYLRNFAHQAWDFTLAIGDDWTDESLFSVLSDEAYPIRVGFIASTARFNLESSQKVLSLLQAMINTDHESHLPEIN